MENVKNIVLVLSGKGGVGKSSVTAQLALSLLAKGFKVGILDIDLTGPSIPKLFGLENSKIHQSSAGWVPVYTNETKNLGIISVGFLLPNNQDPIIWRGPKKNAMIKQFVNDVYWSDLDYLLIDTPPGTSDEHISIIGFLKAFKGNIGGVLVTTPQMVSLQDVKREINFCGKLMEVDLKILGLIENMSGFVCPTCEECTNLFSSGGGEALAKSLDIKFLGRIPVDPNLTKIMEGDEFCEKFSASPLSAIFQEMLVKLQE